MAAAKPLIEAALGARGTGKSAWVKQRLDKLRPTRLAVWDLMQEYTDLQSTGDLGEFIRSMKARSFRLAFHPSRDDRVRERQFDLWCYAQLAAARVTCVVEELAFVTKPMKAPPGWREMVLLGRHERHRLSIIGTSQRPASIDKDFLSNCDLVHCGRLAYKPDAVKAAEVLAVPFEELLHLPDLAWIERAAGATQARRGTLSFGGAKPKRAPPKGGHPKGANLPEES